MTPLLLALAAQTTADANAQPEPSPVEETAPAAEQGEEIVVTGAFQRDLRDSASPVSVVVGAELERDLRPQIGEALARQPGVSATSFGPNASRPVLRGLAGERVRVLTDGIGAFDVSNTSADHAVAIDPLLAERLEVLRGPASLRFGSSAIGGVVNVIDRRIPLAVPDATAAGQVRAGLGSAAEERSAGANLSFRLSDQIALSGGGSLTDTEDLRVGGFLLSEPLRAEAQASSDPDVRTLADLAGRLPNSGSSTRTANAGLAFIDAGGDLGVAISRYESTYGLPIRFDLAPGAEQEAVSIEAQQWRGDIRGSLNFGGGFVEQLSFRAGYADYEHVERESDGGVGTLFANKGLEGRAELRQRRRGGWQGVSGVQYFNRDFLAVGAEAFVPPNITDQFGAFTLQEVEVGAVRFEVGGRIERTNIVSESVNFDRSFTATSIAGGAFWTLTPAVKLGLNLSSTARAPAAEELLADGPHVGTQSYEIGNPNFDIERARGIEAIMRLSGDRWRIDASAYHTRFAGYIYEFATGQIFDEATETIVTPAPGASIAGLPVFQFAQGDATYRGFEVEGQATLVEGPVNVSVDGLIDAVEAEIDDFGPAPRIPPLRLGLGIEARGKAWGARIEGERTTEQTRVTGLETATPGFTLVNASADWKPWANRDVRVTLSASNLFDVEARRHASFLKDYAPLAGRDIRLGVSARF